jgi:hypothetical protein
MADPRQGRRFLDTDPRFVERFGDPFRPLEPDCGVLQFHRPLPRAQLAQAGALVAGRPDVQLYVYGSAGRDLDFLEHFPTLRRLHVALYELADVSGLVHVRERLEELTFGKTKAVFSLRFLQSLPALNHLFLVGHKKDLASVQSLAALRSLGLSGITLPDLSLLLPLKALRRLQIFLGGTADLALLPHFAELEALSLMRITRLSDLGMLADLHALTSLRLDWMRNVTALPSLARLSRLDSVELDTMKGLGDLAPIAAAPALRRLVVGNMPQLTAESFRCLVGHPRLEELWAYTGKSGVNAAVRQMFPAIARG